MALVYKLSRIVSRADFSDQLRKIIIRYKRIGYIMNVMRQSVCLVINPITVWLIALITSLMARHFNCSCIRLSDGPCIKLVGLLK